MHPSLFRRFALRPAACMLAAGLCALAPQVRAFDQPPDADFQGRQFTIMRLPVVAGGLAPLGGAGFRPGQQITVRHGGQALDTEGPCVTDAQGRFYCRIRIPADAVPGIHPVVVTTSAPTASAVFTVQVSPQVPLSGEQAYAIERRPLAPGLYQAAYSPRLDRIFVTSSQGRAPVRESALLRLDPRTLAIEASATPPAVEGRTDGSILGVYGLGLDDANGRLWTGNVRAGTVSVYDARDLRFIKSFPPGLLKHPRDIVAVPAQGKVYVSDMELGALAVFDAATLAHRGMIPIASARAGAAFVPTGMVLDAQRHTLYVAGLRTQEVAAIDTRTDQVARVLAVPGSRGLMGLSFDPAQRLLYIAGQNSDNLTVLDVDSGRVRAQTPTGANPLSVVFNPADGLAYVANRASATVTVVDRDGRIVANLPGSSYNNHVSLDGRNHVLVLNKKTEAEEADGDRISRIRRVAARP